MNMDYNIGVDFDNTILSYDDLMYEVAIQQNLIYPDTPKSKQDIRDHIRQLPNGERKWQGVQALVYGERIREAKLINGVKRFFELCKQNSIHVYIISHKTKYANFYDKNFDLRMAALIWMKMIKFFDEDGLGLNEENVCFESTRHEKIERIKYLKCTHFIDDLEETFLENSFPPDVKKILFKPHIQPLLKQNLSLYGIDVFTNWEDINNYFFKTKS